VCFFLLFLTSIPGLFRDIRGVQGHHFPVDAGMGASMRANDTALLRRTVACHSRTGAQAYGTFSRA
jgi:hypothetical protein